MSRDSPDIDIPKIAQNESARIRPRGRFLIFSSSKNYRLVTSTRVSFIHRSGKNLLLQGGQSAFGSAKATMGPFRTFRPGQKIVFKTIIRVNLNHFRGLLVSGRLSISALNRADRPFVVLSGTDFAPRIQVDSYSSLN